METSGMVAFRGKIRRAGLSAFVALVAFGTLGLGLAQAQDQVVAEAVPSDERPAVGQQIDVAVNIDMTNMSSPNDKLGSYTASLTWDTSVLRYKGYSGGTTSGFDSPTVNEADTASGTLRFSDAYANGASGKVNVIHVTFEAVGYGQSVLDLEFSAMAAAYTFADLLPYLTVNDGNVDVATLTVTSPNGGENWEAGSTHDITWTSGGTSGNVKIEYSSDGGSSWTTVVSSTADDGTYTWTVPNDPSDQCLVRITDTDGYPSDQSDAVFRISPAPSLTVTSPNGGEDWQVGSTHDITWTSSGTSGNVKIEYSTDNGSNWTTITSSTVDDGSYSWTIPNTPSDQCLVKVSDTDG
ncbi:MAG: hypothetical protein GXO73_08770, partial [Calditrichaeota bacterium]|nr:hypothetical protein [Calditrichota bacterium]